LDNIEKLLSIAAMLPSGLNDPKSAQKLMDERIELLDAIGEGDYIGALTEGADAAYYAVKYLDWVAHQLEVSIDQLFDAAIAKYALRSKPGNHKNDVAERDVVHSAVIHGNN